MKKIFSLIAAFALLTGCDDGDMTYKTFDFGTDDPTPCTVSADAASLRYYKINASNGESLILDIAPTALKNQSTLDANNNNVPYTITISVSGTNKLTYKNYATNSIAKGSVCNLFDTDDNAEVWKGEGTLSVITVERRVKGKLRGYTHAVTMQNISFYNGEETIIINNNLLGNISKDFNFDFNFDATTGGDPTVLKCSDNNLLYTVKADELLSVSVLDYNAAFNSSNTTLELPLGNDNNLNFKVFNGTLSTQVICTPAGGGGSITPAQTQFWKATAGKLRIDTVMDLGVAKYKIYAIDAIFTNTVTGESFALKDIAETSPDIPNAYYFGLRE
ncbi:hypothetical protein R1T16_00300 [Flavobacterium sp. DG1-102-2]|uniref:hypothetical protein n=1 Tax=Flavobacterium sp. DG1-102-2 TaxID=3081663 RepID=UPI002949AA56|nr:hypothetical protein [Flavobacterium sp. DG1-102-2]MDV6166844.1 hypothetical protein [Flavobacterium sp. DG1-102-2]